MSCYLAGLQGRRGACKKANSFQKITFGRCHNRNNRRVFQTVKDCHNASIKDMLYTSNLYCYDVTRNIRNITLVMQACPVSLSYLHNTRHSQNDIRTHDGCFHIFEQASRERCPQQRSCWIFPNGRENPFPSGL